MLATALGAQLSVLRTIRTPRPTSDLVRDSRDLELLRFHQEPGQYLVLPSPDMALVFFLPAMVCNLMLYLSARVYGRGLVVPLDLGHRVRNKRLIGDGRGLTSLPRALAAGLLCGAIQGRLEEAFFLVVGAQFGMVCNSLLKRARGLKRGEAHLPWDHIDYIIGASLVYACYYPFSVSMLLAGLVYGGLVHFALGGLIRRLLEHSG